MLTFPSIFEQVRRANGRRPAVMDDNLVHTWNEHVERIAAAAGLLRDRGLRPQDRFAILSKNSRRQFEIINAGLWSGIVAVPVNYRLAPPEIALILADSGIAALAVDPSLLSLLDSAELAAWKKNAFILGPATGNDLENYDSLLEAATPAPPGNVQADQDAMLLYTGGTTGRSKGVRLTHSNILSNALQIAAPLGVKLNESWLHVAPMFHSADLIATAFTLRGGAHCFLADFAPDRLLAALQDHRINATMLAPAMLIMAHQNCDFSSYDLARLRLLIYGSSTLPESWIMRTLHALPHTALIQGYGLTETSPILTFLEHQHHVDAVQYGEFSRLRSAGKAVPGVNLAIVDEDGRELSHEEPGELVARGPNVTPGYYNLPEVNAAVFRDGWFHTGDIAQFDTDGFLYLLDRKKDVIITGGENVYSAEVERVLLLHPSIAEAAVIGVPDPIYGEALLAVIVPATDPSPAETEVIDFCRSYIGNYKIPRKMIFIDQLPRNTLGKVQKAELRKRYA